VIVKCVLRRRRSSRRIRVASAWTKAGHECHERWRSRRELQLSVGLTGAIDRKLYTLRHSSRSRPLKLSIRAFSTGLPCSVLSCSGLIMRRRTSGYAQLLISLRRYPEAVSHIELARRADPVCPVINSCLPYIYLASRDYGRAGRKAHRAVSLEPYAPIGPLVPRTRLSLLKPGGARRRGAGTGRLFGRGGIPVGVTR
jgi:hypothetical protein